jgi:sugar phosphate permease
LSALVDTQHPEDVVALLEKAVDMGRAMVPFLESATAMVCAVVVALVHALSRKDRPAGTGLPVVHAEPMRRHPH